MSKHGGVVGGLNAQGNFDSKWWWWRPLQLPVPQLLQLRSLDLTKLKVQLAVQCAPSTRSSTRRRASSLAVTSNDSSSSGRSSDVNSLAVLPQLQELKLRDCLLTAQLASQLLTATTLSELQWEYVELFSDSWTRRVPTFSIAPLSDLKKLHTLRFKHSTHGDGSVPSSRQLLAALQHLTQLRHLHLQGCRLHRAAALALEQQVKSYECFSALTASTQLTALHLAEWYQMPIPQAAFEHMLPPGRVLPHLEALVLEGPPFSVGQFCVEAAEIGRIAASCPALQKLTLVGVTSRNLDVSCLKRLPSGVTAVQGLQWSRTAP
jgi:hypothetical protein